MSKFIKRNTTPVPESVKNRVRKYLEEHNLGELIEVRRASDHPADSYLYMVISKKPNRDKLFHKGDYSYFCWTCWNNDVGSLNYGHHHLENYDAADAILKKFFHRISGPLVID